MKKKKVKRKWHFTEVVILIILAWSVTVFERGIYFAFKYENESPWFYLFSAVGVLASSAFGMFVWKAKNENVPKILNNPNFDQEEFAEKLRYDLEEEYRNLEKDKYY